MPTKKVYVIFMLDLSNNHDSHPITFTYVITRFKKISLYGNVIQMGWFVVITIWTKMRA